MVVVKSILEAIPVCWHSMPTFPRLFLNKIWKTCFSFVCIGKMVGVKSILEAIPVYWHSPAYNPKVIS